MYVYVTDLLHHFSNRKYSLLRNDGCCTLYYCDTLAVYLQYVLPGCMRWFKYLLCQATRPLALWVSCQWPVALWVSCQQPTSCLWMWCRLASPSATWPVCRRASTLRVYRDYRIYRTCRWGRQLIVKTLLDSNFKLTWERVCRNKWATFRSASAKCYRALVVCDLTQIPAEGYLGQVTDNQWRSRSKRRSFFQQTRSKVSLKLLFD